MSKEGHLQLLCKAGHEDHVDLLEVWHGPFDPLTWTCDCGEPLVWWNEVDETNWDPYPENGEVLLEELTPKEWVTLADGRKAYIEPTYRIPDTPGNYGPVPKKTRERKTPT